MNLRSLPASLAALARSRIGLPILIIVVTVLAVVLLTVTRPRLQPVPAAERIWTVSAVTVRRQTIQPELDLFGEVVAGRRSELRALVAGPIARVGGNFRDGGVVARGELLLQVDPFDYETTLADSRSRQREAEVRLEVVERDLQRARELYAKKLVAPQFLDNAELAVRQQEAITEQQRIAVRRAERALADTRLIAPYAGVIGGVNANLGKQLSLNDKVAEITDTGQLEVRFSLSNSEYGRLLASGEAVIGRAARVIWEVGENSLEYPAIIQRVGAEITAATGGVDAYAVMTADNPATPLRPGAFVRVRLADRAYSEVMSAPESALYGEDTVYVINGEDRLEARRITLAGYAGNDMLFRSAADPPIADGARVMVSQLREIGAGAKVQVR